MIMFQNDLKIILNNEGGFVDDPDDPGGRTNFGITQATYNNYNPGKDVKNITQDEVASIYMKGYYIPSGASQLDGKLATQLFDCAVNCGVVTAIKMLQKVIGVSVDGVFGPQTLSAVTGSHFNSDELARLYALERVRYYTKLALKRPVMVKFLTSWLARTLSISP